jgi:very-short-patch-repair endonuclease
MRPLGALSATELGAEPERLALQYIEQIAVLLDWNETICRPLERDLRAAGFDWARCLRQQRPQPGNYPDLARLRDALRQQMIPAVRTRAEQASLATLEQNVAARSTALASFPSMPSLDALRSALNGLDIAAYERAHDRIVELHDKARIFEQRARLVERLHQVAPGWAAALRQREAVHGQNDVPGDVAEAWLWRQLHDELVRRSATSLEAIERDLESQRSQLHAATAELIERRAWAAQVRRTTPEQRQALMGYRDAVRRIGQGTGKRAPKFRVEAQRLMGDCRSAVPVWIMPLATVADTFDPRNTRFKIAIIDEASQCDVMGLIAFYLADKVLVVGDDEQVSPAAVGQKLDVVEALIEEHLGEVPNRKLYDGQMSIYELAQQSFARNVRLVEHFRCVPDIIEFSNHLSYDGQVTPLRDPGSVPLRPFVVEHRVAGQERGKVNRAEAAEIVALVAAALEQPEYRKSTFGIISLLGDEQAYEIERLLRTQLSPAVMEKHRILCGNAAQFQGDERDVMFLSMVKSRLASGGPHPLMGQGYLDANKKRFNVAASRARNQMWLVHSLDPATDLKSGDLRLRLIQHAQTPHAVTEAIRRAEGRAESDLERLVINDLGQAGYRVLPQWWVGYYRIDIVVVGANGKKVAIECEGDRYHAREKLLEDVARQAVLERLGWQFIRIRGSQYYRDGAVVMRDVVRRLGLLGIVPDDAEPSVAQSPDNELVERVRRRAAELLRENPEGNPEERKGGRAEDAAAAGDASAVVGEDSEADDEVGGGACIRCQRSDRNLILYRGGEMCALCIEAARREGLEELASAAAG